MGSKPHARQPTDPHSPALSVLTATPFCRWPWPIQLARLINYSRNKAKQWRMATLYSDYDPVRFIICDALDLAQVLSSVEHDHAAATKVHTAKYKPFECAKKVCWAL